MLTVAGMLKRNEPMVDEELILMRALRDLIRQKWCLRHSNFLAFNYRSISGVELEKAVDEALQIACQSVCKERGFSQMIRL